MSKRTRYVANSIALIALSACGGGDDAATGPAPIFAPPIPPASADYVGKTFPVRYFGLEQSGGVIGRFRGTGTAEVISEEEINLTINGVTYNLVDTIPVDGEFVDGVAEAEFNDFSATTIGFNGGNGVNNAFFGVFGFQTDPADMPSGFTAGYSSTDTSTMYVYAGAAANSISGDASLSVNFTNNTVSGTLFSGGDFVMSIENGTISGNTINGTVSGTYDDGGGPDPISIANSDVDGWFFGNNALDLAGTFEGDFTVPVGGGATDFVGGFIAQD